MGLRVAIAVLTLASALRWCQAQTNSQNPCDEVLRVARNESLKEEFADWHDKVASLEKMTLQQLEAEAKKAGGGGSLSIPVPKFPVSASGGGGTEESRKSELRAALIRYYEQSSLGRLQRKETFAGPDVEALKRWRECIELRFAQQKFGLTGLLLSNSGELVTVELAYYNEDVPPVNVIKVDAVNVTKPQGLENTTIGRASRQFSLRRENRREGSVTITVQTPNGPRDTVILIPAVPKIDPNNLWKDQILQAFAGAQNVVASSCFRDKIIVEWQPNPNAIDYEVWRALKVGEKGELVHIAHQGQPTRFEDTGVKLSKRLDPATMYYYRVLYIFNGNSQWAGEPVAGKVSPLLSVE